MANTRFVAGRARLPVQWRRTVERGIEHRGACRKCRWRGKWMVRGYSAALTGAGPSVRGRG